MNALLVGLSTILSPQVKDKTVCKYDGTDQQRVWWNEQLDLYPQLGLHRVPSQICNCFVSTAPQFSQYNWYPHWIESDYIGSFSKAKGLLLHVKLLGGNFGRHAKIAIVTITFAN